MLMSNINYDDLSISFEYIKNISKDLCDKLKLKHFDSQQKYIEYLLINYNLLNIQEI